jgi:hypothetical protein
MGAAPAVLAAAAGYFGSRTLFAIINKNLFSQSAKGLLKIALIIGYFPMAILLAMLIAQVKHLVPQ